MWAALLRGVLYALAVLAAFLAVITRYAMCELDAGGSTMCPDGKPSFTMTLQTALGPAVLGIALAAFVLRLAGRTRLATLVLTLAIVVGLVWLVLNDASVHEWGHGMRLVP